MTTVWVGDVDHLRPGRFYFYFQNASTFASLHGTASRISDLQQQRPQSIRCRISIDSSVEKKRSHGASIDLCQPMLGARSLIAAQAGA